MTPEKNNDEPNVMGLGNNECAASSKVNLPILIMKKDS
jgi:hypothetical protein